MNRLVSNLSSYSVHLVPSSSLCYGWWFHAASAFTFLCGLSREINNIHHTLEVAIPFDP
jgi:hypothetical protein